METILPVLCFGPTPALQRGLRFADWDAPGDVVRTREVRWSVGGKATNAARAVVRGGGQATLLGPAGGMNGGRMKALLREEGLEGVWIEVAEETRICQTLQTAEGNRIRELVEDALPLSCGEWGELFAKLEQALPFHAGLLLCGSLPVDAPDEVYATGVELAKAAGRKVILDAKGAPLRAALALKPDFVKINRDELRETTALEDVKAGMHALMEMGAGAVMITDGPRRAFVAEGRKVWAYTLPEIQPVNPIGGGDTVAGVTALNWLAGVPLHEAGRMGLGAGTAQTLSAGPAEFTLDDARLYTKKIIVKS